MVGHQPRSDVRGWVDSGPQLPGLSAHAAVVAGDPEVRHPPSGAPNIASWGVLGALLGASGAVLGPSLASVGAFREGTNQRLAFG
eukprot:1400869-Pyramimonas_sp.AAC.1